METALKLSDDLIEKKNVFQELASIRAQIEKLNFKIEISDANIDAKIEILRAKIDTRVTDVKNELILWIGSVCIVQMALIAGLVLTLAH